MKIVELAVENVDAKKLLKDSKMEYVRSLMDAGWHGPLKDAAAFDSDFWSHLDQAAQQVVAIGVGEMEKLAQPGWSAARIRLSDSVPSKVDDQVGAMLEHLDHETIVLMRVIPGANPAFVLAGPHLPPVGAIKAGMEARDLTATLLELLGLDPALAAPGRSLVAGSGSSSDSGAMSGEDEEAIVRERLMGLGYLG